MRKTLLIIASVLLTAFPAISQDDTYYGPTDKWPYLYGQFRDGTVHFIKGNGDVEAKINICIADGHLHYIDENGVIMEAENKELTGAEIGGERFVSFAGVMYLVIVSNENGCVVKSKLYDQSSEGKVDIGYGISSESFSAFNADLSSFNSIGQNFLHAKLTDMLAEKELGTSVATVEKYYILAGNHIIGTTRKELQELTGKEAADAFLKENKIKWNKPETLLPVVDFIAGRDF